MLTSAELARLRADVLATLTDTCSIQRPTASVDSYGHTSESYSTVGTAVACRLDPAEQRSREAIVAGREANRNYYWLTLPWNADVDDGDRVVVGSVTMEVLQLNGLHSQRIVKRALLANVAM